jgi:hypothetical protein
MRLSTLRMSAMLPKAALFLAAAVWAGSGSVAYAHGGGGHGGGHMGGGHMGGGHMGGGHMGWGGHHHGGGGYHHHGGYYGGGYYGGFYPGFLGFGLGGLGYGGLGYGGYGGYGGLGYGGYGGYGGLGYGGYGGYRYGSGYLYGPYLYGGYGTGASGYGYPGYGYSTMYSYPITAANSNVVARTNGPFLGINEQPMADANGAGMKVTHVYAGSAAERAGLKVGDVIHSINGYNTQAYGNITWIIQNASPGGTLNMNVRHAGAASDVPMVASVR